MVNDTILASTGTKFENIGLVVISDGVMEATAIPTADITVKPDGTVADRAAAIQKAVDDEYGAVFAKTEVELNGVKAEVRTGETNLGNLITDALVWGAAEAGTKVDAAVTNGGGIRASISKGNITKKDINTVLPFGNTLSIVKVTGAELLEALEASTYCTPETIGGFPHVSGIVFTVDTGKVYDQGEQYPGSTYYGPKSIQRVSIQSVGGKAFDPNATYTIATNDFMAAGGDTYYAFKTASVNYDLGAPMDDVVMDYITEELDGVVTAEEYGAAEGRITIKKGLPFTDVAADAAYYDDVMYVYENSIFNGFTATTFGPDATMTRGQMVTVLWRMSGSPEPEKDCPFTDVAATSPYRKAIAWAVENGLSNGYSTTTFAPGQAISRQQFLAILYRYAQFQKYDVSVGEDTNILSYTDAESVSTYAIPAMQWACGAGIAYDIDGKLMPTAPAPRYQVAEFLASFCQNVVPAGTGKAALVFNAASQNRNITEKEAGSIAPGLLFCGVYMPLLFSQAAMTAFITAPRKPASSSARMPWMVAPPGEQTASFSSPGCLPVSSISLAVPIIIWAALSSARARDRPQATPPSASASRNRSAKAGPQPATALPASIRWSASGASRPAPARDSIKTFSSVLVTFSLQS